ncbi:hypothetical protein C1893_19835 [Pseudomonas sp. MPR-ANC1]|uniref:hypothetical protein n=1 Tax=Pseudomonas sp. MPR-ANC1 TaxID=2075548 RepID=UPI000CD162FB|nr:hypothetical protein [Pseudomonas sp. MPR-ANC1]POA46598.1 hypothetical protein C1893_19835 [Pseudomonas sp. MPR-ANC1]
MNNALANFTAPHLHGTSSPIIVSRAEFESGKAALMAWCAADLNDQVTFVLNTDDGKSYEKIVNVSPGGASSGKVGSKFNSADDWQLIGQQVTTYFTVSRNSVPLGRSETFRFQVLK